MKLTDLLSLLMYGVDEVEYYSENMTFLYAFDIDEIPEKCTDEILKFNIYNNGDKKILEIVQK